MPGVSTPQAKKRRADRTFRDEHLDTGFFIALPVVHLLPGKVLLSLDRTNWEHGETPINWLPVRAIPAPGSSCIWARLAFLAPGAGPRPLLVPFSASALEPSS